MNLAELQVGLMIPTIDGDWLYRDSYNQVWKIVRTSDPYIPLRIELHEKLTEAISPLEALLRKP